MRRWLKRDEAPLEIEPISTEQREKPEDLAVLDRLPEDAINYRAQEALIAAAPLRTWEARADWDARRKKLIRSLKERCFRAFPKAGGPFDTKVRRNRGGWASRYADYKDVVFQSEPGIYVRAQLLTPRDVDEETPLLVYSKRRGDSIYFLDLDELLPVLGRYTVLILNPRLTEHPVTAFQYAEIERAATWSGRTVASMQTWDILRALEWIRTEEKLKPSSITVYGKGEMGIVALYAAILDGGVDRLILRDPPASHRTGPAILNVLRVTDIPEVAGAFAPRDLVFLRDRPFEYSRRIYALQGCAGAIRTSGSLPEALKVWKRGR